MSPFKDSAPAAIGQRDQQPPVAPHGPELTLHRNKKRPPLEVAFDNRRFSLLAFLLRSFLSRRREEALVDAKSTAILSIFKDGLNPRTVGPHAGLWHP